MTLRQHEIKAEDCHEGGDDEEGGPASPISVHASPLPPVPEFPARQVVAADVLSGLRWMLAPAADVGHRLASARLRFLLRPLRLLSPLRFVRLLSPLRFVLRPLLRGGGQVVTPAADVNHVTGVGDQVASVESLGLGLADDVVRVEHPLVAADAARSPDADHAQPRGAWAFNMAAYLDPHGKAITFQALRRCLESAGPCGLSGESGGSEGLASATTDNRPMSIDVYRAPAPGPSAPKPPGQPAIGGGLV